MSKAKKKLSQNPEDAQIKDLAITGPDAEIYDVTDGRRFFYYFDESPRPLAEVIKAGAFRFTIKFGRSPQLVLLSSSYDLNANEISGGIRVIPLEEVPPAHFWFGPKPPYYQLKFDL